MTERFATTPFGGGRISVSSFLRREKIDQRRRSLKQERRGGNDTGAADKWQLLRALTEARAAFNLSDRTICVLEALLSFHPETELNGSAPIIVFPSNAELSLRTRGMADATLRRHLAALVEAGLILRRDSPNGKRYACRDENGEIEAAFGFDLSPLALMAAQIYAAAEEARAHVRQCHALRTEITIHQRDTGKIIEAAIAEKREGDWERFSERFQPLARRPSRQASLEMLKTRRDDLVRLRAEVETAYLNALAEQELSANDVDSERHYQNQNPDSCLEFNIEQEMKPCGGTRTANTETPEADGRQGRGVQDRSRQMASPCASYAKAEHVPLSYLVKACPTLSSYAKDGISSWVDVMRTVELVRSMLGISPDAWRKARVAMGDMAAACTIAAILERAEKIRSPGGYLRVLTARAELGKFSIQPMLAALEARARKSPG